MRVWRLCKERHAKTAFTGAGARDHGGRWNHRGTSVVYCSSTLSLAALEMLVHVDPTDLPDDLVAIPADVPEAVSFEEVSVTALPAAWRSEPPPDELKDVGSTWVAAGRTAVLFVPSAVVPVERNVLFNPAHAEFARVRIGRAEPFAFDPRLRR